MMRVYSKIFALGLFTLAAAAQAAIIEVRQAGGERQFTAELGQILEMEVFIDASGEELTGYSFFLSPCHEIFRVF